MKKISKFLVAILLTIININNVNADECANYTMDYVPGSFDTPTIQMKGISAQQMLTFRDKDGKTVPGYCRNAGKSTGAALNGTTYTCKSTVFDSTTASVTSDIKKAYEAGVIKILATGYNVTDKSSGVAGYTATDLAVKVFELIAPDSINTGASGKNSDYLKAFKDFANKMLKDEEINKLLKEVYGNVRNSYSDVKEFNFASNDQAIKDRAKELIIIGLNAAKNYRSNGAASLTWNDNPFVTRGAVVDDGNYHGSISYTFNLSGFTSSSAYARIKFTCPNCTQNGVNYVLSVNDENLGQNYSDEIDLLSRATDGSGNVTLKVEFTGNSSYGCEGLDYNINVRYKDDSISSEAYDMYPNNCPGNACQHFYVLKSTDVEKTASITNTFAMCNLTCEELQAKCDAKVGNACNELSKQYPDGCINCAIGLVNNECADPGSVTSLDLIEGYEVDPKTCTQSTEANITGCILENKDAAGNSYVDTNLGNDNCSVSCKEDFHFNFPGNLDVSSGRYFTLKAEVKATKTCYLKLNGDPEHVKKDFKEKAEGTKEIFNACKQNEALAKLNCPAKQESKTCGHADKPSYCCIPGTEQCSANEGGKYTDCYYPPKTIKVDYYDCEYQYESATQCGTKTTTATYTSHATVDSSSCAVTPAISPSDAASDSDCTTLKEQTTKPKVQTVNISGMSGAKGVYVGGASYTTVSGGSSNSIYNGVGTFNACSLWEMTYDYDPDLYFDYEDSYMKDAITNKLELIGDVKVNNTTHYYCRSNDGDKQYELCNGSVNGWSTSPIFDIESVCVCSGDNCSWEQVAFNVTRRMKESITVEASYITPTQFYTIYPTGAIVAARTASGIENSSELTNALPVGLGTPQGIHHYALYAKNLGEYFATGKFGRIWGDKNSVVSVTLKSTDKCINKGALKYDTNLNGTYIDKGVYVCDYNINTNSCVKTTDENGKVTYRDKEGNITDEETYNRICKCPDCPVECGPGGCTCDGDNCPVVCPTCVYNGGKNFNFRSISLNNINPNNRKLGANWSYDNEQISTALELKAKATTDEIITDGETIYDEGTNKYVMKVNLDSAMINKIKKRKDKDYTSNTLKCYDYKQDGKTYNNIFCYSTYIDELLNSSSTSNKITFSVERPLSDSQRINSQNSAYWTTWTKALENSRWTINTVKGISYYKSNYGEIGIGPSWK